MAKSKKFSPIGTIAKKRISTPKYKVVITAKYGRRGFNK